MERLQYPQITTFNKDGRKPLHELYESYFLLVTKYGWDYKQLYSQEIVDKGTGQKNQLPSYEFRSPNYQQYGVGLLENIHGEEPAPLQASANKVHCIAEMSKEFDIPITFIPTTNMKGYVVDDRYPNAHRSRTFGVSVGDPDHALANQLAPSLPIPRRLWPSSEAAKALTQWIVETQPALLINLHEDLLEKNRYGFLSPHDRHYFYSYGYGEIDILNQICPMLKNILEKSGYPMQKDGATRFGEKIVNGWVLNSMDGSLDDFSIRNEYIDQFRFKHKSPAFIALVIETIIHHQKPQTITERAKVHEEVIDTIPKLWEIVQKYKNKNDNRI
ncbi:MAG TPA: hypothetical protein VL401_00620 [Alphaproteobacteria bacterium]|jgi:hypothetical protein|nr:hypothetical protein [Alphaproteobacteria bacterium]